MIDKGQIHWKKIKCRIILCFMLNTYRGARQRHHTRNPKCWARYWTGLKANDRSEKRRRLWCRNPPEEPRDMSSP